MEALPRRPPPPRSPWQRVLDWIEWVGLARLAVGALSVLAVVAGAWWLLRPPPTPVESTLPYTEGATTVAATSSSTPAAPVITGGPTSSVATEIVVHVAGAVAVPGVYRLAPTARVVDAIAAAGGAAAEAQLDAVNLAAPVHDGDRVYVPGAADPTVSVPAGVSSSTGTGSGGSTPAGPIDLNTATVEQLDALPGVGPATAQAIVDHRDRNGPFASVDALGDVRGIGPAKLEALRPLVTV